MARLTATRGFKYATEQDWEVQTRADRSTGTDPRVLVAIATMKSAGVIRWEQHYKDTPKVKYDSLGRHNRENIDDKMYFSKKYVIFPIVFIFVLFHKRICGWQ